MRKIWNFMLLGIITMGLGMSVTSCKDDDNNNDNNKQSQEAVTDAATNFWAVVGQLVGIDQSTDDYADKSFEPTIGTPKDGNATIREVLTNDAATAAMRFCDLVGLEDGTVDENTATYTWQDDAVGTLTYTKTQDGSSLATVDVAIRQIPGLRQIVYLTAAQQGKNGDFPGTAWYRFGDVVSKPNADGGKEYWVCVRPCFGPEYKGVSHWITVSPLPNKNIYTYDKASNKIKYQLPTNIGVNEEHMQNLAEMLYAIAYPEQWQQNLTDNYAGGLKMFHDFKFSNIKYHNKFFWERVKKAWDDKEISATAFGLTLGEISALLGNRGLNFLAKGYSWPWGNSPTLYQYNYKQGTSPKELNMHKKTFTKVSKNVISNNITLNLEDYILYRPYWTCDDFFGDEDPRFIIRHATGKELMGSDVDVYQSMNGVNGIEDVYIYNGYYKITPGRDTAPEVLTQSKEVKDEAPAVGSFIGADGKFYSSKVFAESAGGGARAVVLALNDADHPVENGTDYNGLAMSLDLYKGLTMCDKIDYECGLKKHGNYDELLEALDGLAVTTQLKAGCGKEHVHPIAQKCEELNDKLTEEGKQRYSYSDWFIPSFGQWLVAMKSIGLTLPEKLAPLLELSNKNLKVSEEFFTKIGLDWNEFKTPFITSSVATKDESSRFLYINYQLSGNQMYFDKTSTMDTSMRPFILFKYKE